MIKKWIRRYRKSQLKRAIAKYAKEWNLPFDLVASIVFKESHGDVDAWRYEPVFFKRYLEGKNRKDLAGYVPSANKVSLATELNARAISWGCAQVLGATGRELGYSDIHLWKLGELNNSLYFGCKKLRQCFTKERRERDAIARYNGNPKLQQTKEYANDVLRIKATKQYEEMFE